jgi:hypothetical protein
VLSAQGHRPTFALERRISDTLLGAAVDHALADALRHGRLTAEVPPPGFDALMGTPGGGHLRLVPGGKTAAKTTAPATSTPRAPREAREEREELHEAVASALEREAVAREAAAGQLQHEVEAAAATLADKRRALREAQREARRARAAARKARRAR